MENGPNYHTYTFSIQRSNPLPNNPVENLVFTPLPDGGYKAYLVTYNLTEAEKNTIINGGSVSINGKGSVTPLEGNFSSVLARTDGCTMQINDYYTVCDGNLKHSNGETAAQGCTASNKSQHIVTMTMVCQGGLSPQPGIDNPSSGEISPGEAGGGLGNNNPCAANGVYVNPQDPANSNCNAGVVTQPNLEFNFAETPCGKIKAKFADTRFKEKVNAIDKPEVFDYDHEMGYAAGYPPAGTGITEIQYPPMENTLGTHNVKLPDGDQYFGFIHSHNNESNGGYPVKIFSPADLATFLTSCVANADLHGSINDAYTMVITSEGNYMLQFTGNSSGFGIGPNTIKFWKLWYERESKAIQNEDGTIDQNKVEQLFLRFLKEKVKIDGIELYNIEKTTGKAKKLTLGNNNNVIPTPCP